MGGSSNILPHEGLQRMHISRSYFIDSKFLRVYVGDSPPPSKLEVVSNSISGRPSFAKLDVICKTSVLEFGSIDYLKNCP